ncbi:MAG: DNA-directed RNA polymerase subunit beta', partial [Leptospiraceae bacterium]|nr:DNA-directed RNA polymerase subunit beta' [Leptospiraceae bacterium]
NTLISRTVGQKIENLGYTKINVRSPLTCESRQGICTTCYGMDMARLVPAEIGEAVGTIAAQSIGQPGTQLTMRTFHIGGAASAKIQEKDHKVSFRSVVRSINGRTINNSSGQKVFSRRGSIVIQHLISDYALSELQNLRVQPDQEVDKGEVFATSLKGDMVTAEMSGKIEIDSSRLRILGQEIVIPIKVGTIVNVNSGDIVEANKSLAEFDPFNELCISDIDGTVSWVDLEVGKNLRRDEDAKTLNITYKVIEQKREKLKPRLIVGSEEYIVPVDAILVLKNGDKVKKGDTLYKIPSVAEKTRDITGGLPRVDELFEARRPKDPTTLAEVDGKIEDRGDIVKEKRVFYIIPDNPEMEKIKVQIPVGKQLRVQNGEYVKQGDQLDDGSLDPHDILKIKGPDALYAYLVKEVQEVYRLQGVHINDKHIEVVVRQMLRKVIISDSGDTSFVTQQQVDKFAFKEENQRVEKEGGSSAQSQPVLLGLTKASLNTESFFSAASFQETTKVLTDAAIKGKTDKLIGLKENVIIGHMIPAGTGMKKYQEIDVYKDYYGDLEKIQNPVPDDSGAVNIIPASTKPIIDEEEEDE